MSQTRNGSIALWARATVFCPPVVMLLALAVYVAAYVAMVRPEQWTVGGWIMTRPFVYWGPWGKRIRNDGDWIIFFFPAWDIDRQLRPSVWKPPREIFPGSGAPLTWPSSNQEKLPGFSARLEGEEGSDGSEAEKNCGKQGLKDTANNQIILACLGVFALAGIGTFFCRPVETERNRRHAGVHVVQRRPGVASWATVVGVVLRGVMRLVELRCGDAMTNVCLGLPRRLRRHVPGKCGAVKDQPQVVQHIATDNATFIFDQKLLSAKSRAQQYKLRLDGL